MEKELKQQSLNDDILSIVKSFIDYFENATEHMQNLEEEQKP